MSAPEPTAPADEVSRLHYLIDQVRGGLDSTTTDNSRPQYATPAIDDARDGIRLPGISAIFPAFSSARSIGASAYPTPASNANTPFTPSGKSPAHFTPTPHVPPEQHALSSHLEEVRRGFAFHRKCNRYAFIACDEAHVEHLLNEYQGSIVENRSINDVKTCEVFSVAVICSLDHSANAARADERRATSPRPSRPATYDPRRPGRTGADEHRLAQIGLPAFQRRSWAQQLNFQWMRGATCSGQPAAEASPREVGDSRHGDVDAVWLAAVSEQRRLCEQIKQLGADCGTAARIVRSRGLKQEPRTNMRTRQILIPWTR